MPDLDYWDIFPSIIGDTGFVLTLETLYKTSNEHIVALTKLFYLANHLVTQGDNFGLSVIACTFSLLVAACFAKVLSRSAAGPLETVLLATVAAVAVFTPMAAHNYFIGMSGVAWLGANCFAVASAALMMLGAQRRSTLLIMLAGVAALCAGHMYSTGIVAMTVIGVQALLLRSTRRLGMLYVALGIVYLAIVVMFQRVPESHGERTFDFLALIGFALTFLGAGLTTDSNLALLWGGVGLATFGWLVASDLQRSEGERGVDAFWIAIGIYVLMNAALAAIGRSGMGGSEAAMASRYASLPSLFWVAVLGLWLSQRNLAALRESSQRWRVSGGTLLGVVLAASVLITGQPRVERLENRADGKQLATLAIRLGVRDDSVVIPRITSAPDQLYSSLEHLRTIGHVPFNQPTPCPDVGQTVMVESADVSRMVGHVDTASELDDGWYRLSGWALAPEDDAPPLQRNPESEARCLLLIDEDGRVLGMGLGGVPRPDVAKAYKRERNEYGWIGYARVPDVANGERTAYAAIPLGGGRWIRSPHGIRMPGPTPDESQITPP
ncbi:hypothetical protein [Coralloluteibacterium thermophilus]|uniref:Uncharacterized protein n=1 Tax=Coralloluteibacterium thermophilum TaxID=2707049 RepID=A0ABV9NJT1_9GAMM